MKFISASEEFKSYKLKDFKSVEDLTYSLGFKNRNSLYVLKCLSKDKFKFITSLDEYFDIAIKKYINYVSNTIQELCDMFYYLDDRRLLGDFGEVVVKHKIYNSPNKYLYSINLKKRCFRYYETPSEYFSIEFRAISKMENVVKLFYKYKEEIKDDKE